MSFKVGQWMYNYSDDGIWSSCGYFDNKEDAVEEGKIEFKGDRKHFYVGQISPVIIQYGIDTESIFERIAEHAHEEAGEVADDYLHYVDKEHDKVLEDRLNKVLNDWMDEFDYRPSFFKIINTEMITLEVE